MTPIVTTRTLFSPYDSVTLRQRTSQPFLIPPPAEDEIASPAIIRLHVCIEDAELRTAVHALFDGRVGFEVVSGSASFSANAKVRIGRLGEKYMAGAGSDGTRAVLIGPKFDEESVLRALRSGAWAFVSEQSSAQELAQAVEQTANGECPILRWISDRPSAAADVLRQVSRTEQPQPQRKPPRPSPLTENEAEILRRVARGQNTRQIAKELGFQEQTIKNRITGVFNKLGPRSRAGAVAEAQRHGWL